MCVCVFVRTNVCPTDCVYCVIVHVCVYVCVMQISACATAGELAGGGQAQAHRPHHSAVGHVLRRARVARRTGICRPPPLQELHELVLGHRTRRDCVPCVHCAMIGAWN